MQDYRSVFDAQRAFYYSGQTLPIEFRIEQLKKLKKIIQDNEAALYKAIYADLAKTEFETYETELSMFYNDVDHFVKKLKKWTRRIKIKTNIMNLPGKSFLQAHPYGQALIISPWNYPFQLTLIPLAASIAAGNTNMVKPSELSIECSAIMMRLLNEHFPAEYLRFFEGGVEETTAILQCPFDKVFFTGSTAVGSIVAKSTSHYLPSLTLELGGKSPCIICDDAKLNVAAKRILWGKLLNSGQSCIAPDYLLVQRGIKEDFMRALLKEARSRYGEHTKEHRDLPKIINERHYQRLKSLIPAENVVFGGEYDDQALRMDLTIIDDVKMQDTLMQREIFGPLLPIMYFDTLDELPEIVHQNANPLALYVFSNSKDNQDFILNRINFGDATINDTMMHITNPNMPFGGVGASGSGAYHGKHGFDDFSHYKPVLKRVPSNLVDPPIRYVPYSWIKKKLLKLMTKL